MISILSLVKRRVSLLILILSTTTGLCVAGLLLAQTEDPPPSYAVFFPLVSQQETRSGTPNRPWPDDGVSEQSLNVYLTWNTKDQLDTISHYEVRFAAGDHPLEKTTATTTQRYFIPTGLATDTVYSWQIISVTKDDERIQGQRWRFRTESIPDPPLVGTMITVPAGEFAMGCDQGNPAEDVCSYGVSHVEEPLRTVYLDAFAIDKYEVTNGEYRVCVDAQVCAAPRKNNSRLREHYYDDTAFDLYPVLYVSWWDAQTYCAWVDKRLPTEAEWEKAARGTVDSRRWPWGDADPNCDLLNYTNDSDEDGDWTVCVDDTTQVGSYPAGASPFGLMDVAGNAFEWVADKYDVLYYSYAPNENPTGPSFSRVVDYLPPEDEFPWPVFTIRGGSYRPHWFYPRVAHRHWGHHGDGPYTDEPYFRNDQVGFRCARDAVE